jgi:hypothetical protein
MSDRCPKISWNLPVGLPFVKAGKSETCFWYWQYPKKAPASGDLAGLEAVGEHWLAHIRSTPFEMVIPMRFCSKMFKRGIIGLALLAVAATAPSTGRQDGPTGSSLKILKMPVPWLGQIRLWSCIRIEKFYTDWGASYYFVEPLALMCASVGVYLVGRSLFVLLKCPPKALTFSKKRGAGCRRNREFLPSKTATDGDQAGTFSIQRLSSPARVCTPPDRNLRNINP